MTSWIYTATLVQTRAEQAFRGPDMVRRPETEAMREVARKSGFDQAAAAVMAARGRDGFETRTGFTILGVPVRSVRATVAFQTGPFQNAEIYPQERENATDIKIGIVGWDAHPETALVELAGGGGLVLAIMPGYVGTVAMEKGAVSALMYAPAKYSALYESYRFMYDDIQGRRGLAAAAAGVAKLHDLAKSEGAALAEYVRVTKGYDPALGILAAYAYYLADDEQNVGSVHWWMSQTRVTPYNEVEMLAPVPFDVAMLAGRLDFQTPPGIAGCCPMFVGTRRRRRWRLPSRSGETDRTWWRACHREELGLLLQVRRCLDVWKLVEGRFPRVGLGFDVVFQQWLELPGRNHQDTLLTNLGLLDNAGRRRFQYA